VITLNSQLIEVDGATLEVFVGGAAGAPAVCQSHPFVPQTGEGGLVDIAGDACRLVRVNPRGMGRSAPGRAPGDFTLGQQIADLEAVRQRLGVERWTFHGEEGGACLGLLYALQSPRALSGLIHAWMGASGRRIAADERSVLSPNNPAYGGEIQATPIRRHPTISEWPAALAGEWLQLREGLWMLVQGSGPVVMLPFEIERAKQFAEEFVTVFDVRERLDEIAVPTLLVASGLDPVVPLDECVQAHARIRGAELIVLEASGHGERSLAGHDPATYRAGLRRFLGAAGA
jgi:pimeloyl-ACP methyl ester carboxylesterase